LSSLQILESKVTSTEEDISHLKTAIWALSHVSSSTGGIHLLDSLNEPTTLADNLVALATENPNYGVRASAFYACSLLATTDLGASQLESAGKSKTFSLKLFSCLTYNYFSGWICVRQARNDKFPVVQVLDLSPIQPDIKFETDDTGIWFDFPDNKRKRSTSHCSSNTSTGPVITFDDEVDNVLNPILAQNPGSSANASPARVNGVNTVVPPLLSLSNQRSNTLPHSKPPIYQKQHKRSLSDTKDYMTITLESPRYKDSAAKVKAERSPRVRSISVNSGSVPPDFVIEEVSQSIQENIANGENF